MLKLRRKVKGQFEMQNINEMHLILLQVRILADLTIGLQNHSSSVRCPRAKFRNTCSNVVWLTE